MPPPAAPTSAFQPPPVTNFQPNPAPAMPKIEEKPAEKPPMEVQKPPIKKEPPKSAVKKPEKPPPGPGIFGRILGKIGVYGPNQAHLPDDKENTIVWDEKKKKWVDKNATEDENSAENSAPPSDMDLSRTNSTANFGEISNGPPAGAPMPPMGGANKYAGGLTKKRGALGRVDVFKNSQSSPSLSSNLPPPSELFAPVAPLASPVTEDQAPPAPAQAQDSAGAPVFFNPNSIAGPAPSTRRNKYA